MPLIYKFKYQGTIRDVDNSKFLLWPLNGYEEFTHSKFTPFLLSFGAPSHCSCREMTEARNFVENKVVSCTAEEVALGEYSVIDTFYVP